MANDEGIKLHDLMTINVIVTHKEGLPSIELRKSITQPEIVKQIILCALNDIPVTMLPVFRNKYLSLNSLQEKGILKYNKENNNYYFSDWFD